MAVGADMRLNGVGRSVASQNAGTPAYGQRPPMISDSAVQNVANNSLAGAQGSARNALLGMDRGGVSRGKGQQYASQIAEAGATAQANNDATSAAMGAAQANAGASNAYDYAMQQERLGNAGLLENLRNQTALNRVQRGGMAQNLSEAMRRGQFGLDSIRPDYTPLLEALLR